MARSLVCGASPLALALAICVVSTAAKAEDAAAPAPVAPATAAPGATVAEIVVTAEKRAENLETTPVAVTAFTQQARDLLGIESVQDLTDYTPGLTYSTFDNRPYIRGIGRQSDNLAVESGVAVYQDGIYFGANASTILQSDTLFIDRIDVLRGPQSTLYGRNADGGAINYVSRRPTHEFQTEMRAGYSNYEKLFVEGAMSGPINDHVRMLIGGNYTEQRDGGYYINLNGPREGGGVAQGGNGKSYHAEIQFEGDFGPRFDWWAKVATNDYDVSYHTESLLGPLDTREFYNPLFPNQNYGLCLLPGSGVNPGCSAANPDKLLSVTTLPNTPAFNPSNIDPRTFDADFTSRSRERNDIILNLTGTYHADGFDVEYLGGFQSFKYYLNAPFVFSQGISSGVESYVLQGPSSPTPLCSFIFSSNLAGCASNLTIHPAQTQFTFVEDESFFSHEIDFRSTGNGRLQWLAGLYWYHENYDQPVNLLDPNQPQVGSPLLLPSFAPAAPNPGRGVYDQDTRLVENSAAAFFQLDWKMTDTLKLTGGMRYSADRKDGEEYFRLIVFNLESAGLGVNTFGANTPAFDVTSCPAPGPEAGGLYPGAGPCVQNPNGGIQRHLDAHWQALTGTVNLSWTPTPETLVYARYSRGYKTGGFNSGIVTVFPMTAPEFVNAWEVGFKDTFARTFQTNIAAFYYDYTNDQQPLGVNVNGVINTLIANLPDVHVEGVELENIWQPTRNLTLGLNYAYLHAVIANMNGQCIQDSADPLALAPGANTTGCPVGSGLQNLTGQYVPQAAPNKISLTAAYNIPFETGTLTFSGAFIWKAGQYGSPFNRSYNFAPSYTQANLRMMWKDAKDRYTLILFVDNIANTLAYDTAGGIQVTDPGPNQVIDKLASFTAPRTIGGEIWVKFR
ncbi:MAG TPA: TonB-dependent receptor [Caulobacteraceae bacterium]|jgi:iron complex outermembrane receptor protein